MRVARLAVADSGLISELTHLSYVGTLRLPADGLHLREHPVQRLACVALVTLVLTSGIGTAQTRGTGPVRVSDPIELSGPPKKLPPISDAKKAFAKSSVLKELGSKDPKTIAATITQVSSFLQLDPKDSDLYLLRATLSCEINGDKEAMLADVANSIKLWSPGPGNVYDSLREHYALKAKIEFLLKRYAEAMNDLDAAIRTDYSDAQQVFNDGNVKPNQPPAFPCVWTQDDLNLLSRLYAKDYRSPLYIGLYLLQFDSFSLDADYQPVVRLFAQSAELNPSSAVALYYSALPYVTGRLGGILSNQGASCLDEVVPRTPACLALDDTHRTGVRFLTRAIATDPRFEPAYEMRAEALWQLKEYRQAIRDFTEAVTLKPDVNIYNDRALAEMQLKEYPAAIRDYTKAIAFGCDVALCPAYENRADAYVKIHDYPHAIDDMNHAIRNFLADEVYIFNVDQFRRIYPEYDSVSDNVLCEKLRTLFMPQMSHAAFCKNFLVDARDFDDFVLPQMFVKRGDMYADSGNATKAKREYDRVAAGFPKWAENEFTFASGKRVRKR